MFKLRGYQKKGKTGIKNRFIAGDRRVMLWAMTGSGKGLWMADFVKDAIANDKRVLSVMKRRAIIFQTIANYLKYFLIKSFPIMGNLKHQNDGNSIVASIDTLARRIYNKKYDFLREFDLIIIDECHDATSPSYKKLIWWLEGYDLKLFDENLFEIEKEHFQKYYIGLTATPFRVGKKTHTFWQSVVKPIEAHELRDQGYLVDAKVYAPKKIDTSGLRMQNGDFNQKDLFERVSKLEIIGDTVDTYKKYGENKPAICFAVNQTHSKMICEAFNRDGISAIHCDADHSQEERDHATNGLFDGTYKIVVNCNIFSTGFDAPFAEVLIGDRPTDSENLCSQQWGRVLRPCKICARCNTMYGAENACYKCGSSETSYEKKYAIILDHANNTSRWGLPYDIRQPELDPVDSANKKAHDGTGVKTCPVCFLVLVNTDRTCMCGHDFIQNRTDREINEVAGELHEVNEEFLEGQKLLKMKEKLNVYLRIEYVKNWHENSKFYKLYRDFGDDIFKHSETLGIKPEMKQTIIDYQIEQSIQDLTDNFKNGKRENGKVFV